MHALPSLSCTHIFHTTPLTPFYHYMYALNLCPLPSALTYKVEKELTTTNSFSREKDKKKTEQTWEHGTHCHLQTACLPLLPCRFPAHTPAHHPHLTPTHTFYLLTLLQVVGRILLAFLGLDPRTWIPCILKNCLPRLTPPTLSPTTHRDILQAGVMVIGSERSLDHTLAEDRTARDSDRQTATCPHRLFCGLYLLPPPHAPPPFTPHLR